MMARPPGDESVCILAFLTGLPRDSGACAAYIARELKIGKDRAHDALDRLVQRGEVVVLPQQLKVPGIPKPLNLYAAKPAVPAAGGASMFDTLRAGIVRTSAVAAGD